MAKKKHAEEHENHERWLVSYADFITLLFAFFVVMYAISRVDNKKLEQTATSIRWALHMQGSGGTNALPIFQGPQGTGLDLGSAAPKSKSVQQRAAEKWRNRLEKRLRPLLMERNASVIVEAEGQRLAVRLGASRFFDSGHAVLRPEALPVLDSVGLELKALQRHIRVEGHTDSLVPNGDRFRNNWDLSAARAATVANYLEEALRIPANSLSAVGRASTMPIAKNDAPEGREMNRRIELVVELDTSESLPTK